MTYFCLECDADCGPYKHCCHCEDNPDMLYKEHPGFISSAEIENEIQEEEFWNDYTS